MKSLAPKGRAAAAFTLLEMLVVIMIIGILSTALAVNVPKWVDNAKMTASEKQMSKIYMYLIEWQGLHSGAFPSDTGQRFFLRPWKDGNVERVEQNAKIFFSPAMPFEECSSLVGYESGEVDIVEYLNAWEDIGPDYTSYAGFNHGGDRNMRARLRSNPGSTAILGDKGMLHRTAWLYMTADGAAQKLLKADIVERTGIPEEELLYIVPGPGCELEELQTISND